jgi:hypothetical protein
MLRIQVIWGFLNMGTIDVWAQIPTARLVNAPFMESLMRWTGQTPGTWSPNVTSTLAAMDEADVDFAVWPPLI